MASFGPFPSPLLASPEQEVTGEDIRGSLRTHDDLMMYYYPRSTRPRCDYMCYVMIHSDQEGSGGPQKGSHPVASGVMRGWGHGSGVRNPSQPLSRDSSWEWGALFRTPLHHLMSMPCTT